MYDKDFSLNEEEIAELKTKLEGFHERPTDHIDLGRDDFERIIEDCDYFSDRPERFSEIFNNLFEPLYEKGGTLSYQDFQSQMAKHGVDLPERDPGVSVSPEDPGSNFQSDSSEAPSNESSQSASKPTSSSLPVNNKGEPSEARPHLGVPADKKYELRENIKAQQRALTDSAFRNPFDLIGQAGTRFFRAMGTIMNNISNIGLDGKPRSTQLGPIEISNHDPRTKVSPVDEINDLKGYINNMNDSLKTGAYTDSSDISDALDDLNSKFKVFSSANNSEIDSKDQKIISDSFESLDKTIKEKGFGNEDDGLDKKMEEVKKAIKEMFEAIFKKKGPSNEGPAPS